MARPNVQGSFVRQDSGYWSSLIPNTSAFDSPRADNTGYIQQGQNFIKDNQGLIDAGRGIYGAGSRLIKGVSNIASKPIGSLLNIASVYGQLQRGFPNTFQNPQQNPLMEQINYYGGGAARYSGIGATGLSGVQNIREGNYGLGLTDLASSYDQIRGDFNFPSVPGYVNAPINALTLFQTAQKGDYANVGIAGANLYNDAVKAELLSSGAISPNYIGAGAGAINLGLGLKNQNYGQAFYGGAQLGEAGYNLYAGGDLSINGLGNILGSEATAQTAGQAAASTAGGNVAAQGAGFANLGLNQGGEGILGSGIGGGGYVGGAAALIGAGLGARSILRSDGNNGEKTRAGMILAQKTAANYYTAGLSGLAEAGLNYFAPSIGAKVDKGLEMLLYTNPMTAPLALLSKTSAFNKIGASGKGEHQKIRDGYRSAIIENGVKLFDKDYQGTLADGSIFDFGKEDLHVDDKFFGKAAAYGNALAAAQGATGKAAEAISALFAKAAASNAKTEDDVVNNFRHFFSQAGITGDQAQAAANILYDKKEISKDEYNALSMSTEQLDAPKQVQRLPDDYTPTGGEALSEDKLPSDDENFKDSGGDKSIINSVSDYARANNVSNAEARRILTEDGTLSGTSPTDAAKNDERVIPTDVRSYVESNGLKPGQSFKIPGDPNSYTVQEDGQVIGTLIGGGKPDFTQAPELQESRTPAVGSTFNFAQHLKPAPVGGNVNGFSDMARNDQRVLTDNARTVTKTPGINSDGSRINYSALAMNDNRVLHPMVYKAKAMQGVFGRGR